MTNPTAAKLPAALPPSRLPASLLRAADHGEGSNWRPPNRTECRAAARVLPAAIAHAEAHCEQAPPDAVERCLASLALVCQPRGGDTEAMWRARTAEYVRLLPYPADIWRDACDEWATTPDRGRWYPTVAELAALMAPRLAKRRNVAARLRRMAEIAEQPVKREWTPPTEGEQARVASIVASYTARATSDGVLDTGTPHAAEGR